MTQTREQQRSEPSHARTWTLRLTLAESSLLLEALIELPFKQVFELIGKLNHQAQQFYASESAATVPQAFTLDSREFSCCVKALGALPYNRVNALLQSLNEQMHAQQAASADSGPDEGRRWP
ncbi:MAG: hypothetical protein SV422_00245 [Pseudomonadota bacterium]|nr:hypothetical protein [Pseudomonadota bacterium]